MDMKRILENMDSATKGKKSLTAASNVNDMKTILESFNSVNECGMTEMPTTVQDDNPVTMNVNLTARGADAIADLIKLMGGQPTAPQSTTVPMVAPSTPMPSPSNTDIMKKFINVSSGNKEPIMGADDEMSMEEVIPGSNASTTPDEEYSDHHTMTKDLSGGINRQKKMHKPAAGGDNPMALESIKDKLWAALNEKQTTEGRGRGRGKKKTEDMKTTEGRGKVMAGRGRGKNKLMAGRGRGK
jgi:hypothetical protein